MFCVRRAGEERAPVCARSGAKVHMAEAFSGQAGRQAGRMQRGKHGRQASGGGGGDGGVWRDVPYCTHLGLQVAVDDSVHVGVRDALEDLVHE